MAGQRGVERIGQYAGQALPVPCVRFVAQTLVEGLAARLPGVLDFIISILCGKIEPRGGKVRGAAAGSLLRGQIELRPAAVELEAVHAVLLLQRGELFPHPGAARLVGKVDRGGITVPPLDEHRFAVPAADQRAGGVQRLAEGRAVGRDDRHRHTITAKPISCSSFTIPAGSGKRPGWKRQTP